MVRNRSNLIVQEKRASLMRSSNKNKAVALAKTKEAHSLKFVRDAFLLLSVTVFVLSLIMMSVANAKETQDRTLADLADRLQNSVVNISTSQKVKTPFNQRGAPQRPPQLPRGCRLKSSLKTSLMKIKEIIELSV